MTPIGTRRGEVVDNRLSGLLLAGNLPAGAHVLVDEVDGKLTVQTKV